jgi:hypothetical protein
MVRLHQAAAVPVAVVRRTARSHGHALAAWNNNPSKIRTEVFSLLRGGGSV